MLRSSAWQRDRHGEVFTPLDHQYIIASINVAYNLAGDFDSIHATSIGVSVLRSERLDVSISGGKQEQTQSIFGRRNSWVTYRWLINRVNN